MQPSVHTNTHTHIVRGTQWWRTINLQKNGSQPGLTVATAPCFTVLTSALIPVFFYYLAPFLSSLVPSFYHSSFDI